ncbi:hypothetical protein BDK51DRAFT_51143 [Blyttiomyces helicus]|uniref:Uncharacterized protein n=1 Tax=Blyttiomyces helicus TaxID=388810 RepID=A0A4P9WJ67_9FUNG|nr:hypothetical protein BDK51DRAFT_51143 [Blyttiomyces helicus]|eukprot:RKO92402.1 hypothetical protein BDK51DRAFT_51143 [Blyttiomyces helicus]
MPPCQSCVSSYQRALAWAAYAGHVGTCRLLITKYHADRNAKNVHGQIAWDVVSDREDPQWGDLFTAEESKILKPKITMRLSAGNVAPSEQASEEALTPKVTIKLPRSPAIPHAPVTPTSALSPPRASVGGSGLVSEAVVSAVAPAPAPVSVSVPAPTTVQVQAPAITESASSQAQTPGSAPVAVPALASTQTPTLAAGVAPVPPTAPVVDSQQSAISVISHADIIGDVTLRVSAQNAPHPVSIVPRGPPGTPAPIASGPSVAAHPGSPVRQTLSAIPPHLNGSRPGPASTPSLSLASRSSSVTERTLMKFGRPMADIPLHMRPVAPKKKGAESLVTSIGIVSNDDKVRLILPIHSHGHAMHVPREVRSLNLRLLLVSFDSTIPTDAQIVYTVSGTHTATPPAREDGPGGGGGGGGPKTSDLKFTRSASNVFDCLAYPEEGLNAFEFTVSAVAATADRASALGAVQQHLGVYMHRM